jgi:hypothetical protein
LDQRVMLKIIFLSYNTNLVILTNHFILFLGINIF